MISRKDAYVPSILEVVDEAADDGAVETDGYIRPAHPRALGAVQLVLLPVVDVGKVGHPSVVHVLAWEDDGIKVSGVSVGDGVTCWLVVAKKAEAAGLKTLTRRIPSSEA